MSFNKRYSDLLKTMPKDIVDKFLTPLGNKDPFVHENIVRFILLLDEKGYCIKKKEEVE